MLILVKHNLEKKIEKFYAIPYRSDGRSWSLNRAERGAIQLNYEVKSSHATLDIMIQNIQLDNCLKHRKWPVILAKIPQEQTVAAQDVYERELVRIQIIWGSSTERNMKRYRKFYILERVLELWSISYSKNMIILISEFRTRY